MRAASLALAVALLAGCSEIIRDHTFIGDAALQDAGVDAWVSDAGRDAGTSDAGACPACSGSTAHCDSVTGRCVACLEAAHCSDGDPCTVDRCNLNGTCGTAPDTSCVAQVEAGGSHSCALRNPGVLCWGANASGKLGNGGGSDRNMPVMVLSLTGAVAVSAGGGHTCALRTGAVVSCWGRNMAGELGTGTSGADSGSPVAVAGLTEADSVSAGNNFTCVRRVGSDVMCWGSNFYGQLGAGSAAASSATPVAVNSLSDAEGVSAGLSHACAVRTSGEVACWGRNNFQQLGDTTSTNSNVPVAVADIADAVEVSAGGQHSCARQTSGAVSCWGSNARGQLGDGTMAMSGRPVRVASLADATQISAGTAHTCALRATGAVVCWGANDRGQLGDGSATDSSAPVLVSGLANAIEVSAGGEHTCARRATGEVMCWGYNLSGQLGDGTNGTSMAPVMVTGL